MRIALALLFVSTAARADEPLVTLRVSSEADRGRTQMLSVIVAPAAGLRLLDDGPLTLEIDGRTLHRRDAVDPRAETPRFEIAVTPKTATSSTLTAHLTAWVCRGERCRPTDVTQSIAVGTPHAR